MTLTDVIQHPQQAMDEIARLKEKLTYAQQAIKSAGLDYDKLSVKFTAREAELEGRIRELEAARFSAAMDYASLEREAVLLYNFLLNEGWSWHGGTNVPLTRAAAERLQKEQPK